MKRRRPSLLSLLVGVGTFAFAFRRTGKEDRRSLARLKPQPMARKLPTASKNEPVPTPGRDAATPTEIPARGWWAILKRTAAKFGENELMSEAASVTFYALLSLVPAITALVSLYGLVSDPSSIAKQLDSLSGVIPSGGMEIIGEQVKRLTQSPSSGLGVGLVIGLATALWSANAATKAMFSALNDVYGERENRNFFRLTGTSLAFTVGGVVTMILGLGLVVVLPVLFKAIGLDTVFAIVVRVARIPLMLAILVAALAMLFRYGPDRQPPQWRWVSWGGAFGAIGWVVLSVGFSWYVSNFGSYNKTYGSLGAIIGFMTWIWLSTTVLLLAAQLNAEMEVQTARDTTTGAPKPLGQRGAKPADTVA